jgi:hypothetical protein
MAFSNYGPHVDPNAPPFIQNLYGGNAPDFVFEAPDPAGNVKKIAGAFNLVFNLVILGFIAWSFFNGATFLEQFKGFNTPEFWEKLKTEFTGATEEDIKIFVGIGILISAVIIFSIIAGIARDLVKTFKTEKLWYIGAPNGLTVVRGKKIDQISWNQLSGSIEHSSGPTGETLTFKFVPGVMSPPILGSRPKLGNLMAAFNTMTIVNPPNIMEVKRLSEKRIREATKTPETPKTAVFQEL